MRFLFINFGENTYENVKLPLCIENYLSYINFYIIERTVVIFNGFVKSVQIGRSGKKEGFAVCM